MENIILIGMPLSGKSTLGKELSKILKYDLIDTDTLIERVECKSINEIFTLYGEDYSRKKELEVINRLKEEKNKIISTGGGLPIHNHNIYKLKDIGFTVYLKVSLKELMKRMNEKKNNTRPLLKNHNTKLLEEMYKDRIEIYEKAHTTIYNTNQEESLIAIIKEYKKWKYIKEKNNNMCIL
ncbi:shikimate kinase [Clostridium sporogenes]|nr:shikimate kinase [Clostridium sporogenes]